MYICILGECASGKDSIFKRLSNHPSLTPIVTTTSRPPRSAEKNGIDYNFVSDGTFMDMVDESSFMEWTTYTVANGEKWFYGTEWEKCNDKDKNYIVVVNPEGLGTYIRTFGNRNVIGIVIHRDVCDRVIDYLKRDTTSNGRDKLDEMVRRINADEKDFEKLSRHKFENIYHINNITGKFDECVEHVDKIIGGYLK